jgi:hypothetical protein
MLDVLQIRNQPFKSRRINGALTLNCLVSEKCKDDPAGQFLLLKELAKPRRRIPCVLRKQFTDSLRAEGIEIRQLIAHFIERPGELGLKIDRQNGVRDGPGNN